VSQRKVFRHIGNFAAITERQYDPCSQDQRFIGVTNISRSSIGSVDSERAKRLGAEQLQQILCDHQSSLSVVG